jgi:transcription antitermination protein NusB
MYNIACRNESTYYCIYLINSFFAIVQIIPFKSKIKTYLRRNFPENTPSFMISRRVLRIKVMQALYAFFQNGNERVDLAEKNLLKNVHGIYNLYIHQLSFLVEIVEFARETIEIQRNKFIPTEAEKNPNTRFVNNSIIRSIENNPDYLRQRDQLKINWAEQKDMIRRVFIALKESDAYEDYMNATNTDAEADQRILEYIVDNLMVENEELQQYFEGMNVFWSDDFDIGCFMLIKTLKHVKNASDKIVPLPKLFGEGNEDDEKEELNFIRDLFCKTIIHRDDFDDMIEGKVDNWEIDRIAMMDSLLLKMAITEFIDFPTIPTKVTINEYLEISKMYSTPKSKIFINGILDKLLFDLKEKNKIHKKGRGLIG